jgi:hypothetical protein
MTVNWTTNGNSTATVYEASLSLNSDFSSASTITGVDINSASFTGLQPNYKYYARVLAYNEDNFPTAPLALGSKYTRAQSPLSVTVSTSAFGAAIIWNPGANSPETIYEVVASSNGVLFSSLKDFSAAYKSTSLSVNGLLTSTTYYFMVAAMNSEGYATARVASPHYITPPGPGGAPAGSVGGISDPSRPITIDGYLPNSRRVIMEIPAGAFPTATAVSIASSTTKACGSYLINGRTVEVEIFSENNAQPQTPITLTISYDGFIVPGSDIYSLVLARYNPLSGQCLPLETRIDVAPQTLTATLNHFSVFQLMFRTAASNLNDVLVYPNPFKPNRGNGFVTIANMPASTKVRIYTLSGTKVWEGTAGTTGIIIWRGVNSSGELAASGIYLAVVDSSSGKKVLKLAIER